jgi:hypothetical protein
MTNIRRLGISNPVSASPTLLFQSDGVYVCSVFATNKAVSATDVTIWIDPGGLGIQQDIGYVTFNTKLPGNDLLETFRFALNNDDYLYAKANSASVSFLTFGINQTSTTASA